LDGGDLTMFVRALARALAGGGGLMGTSAGRMEQFMGVGWVENLAMPKVERREGGGWSMPRPMQIRRIRSSAGGGWRVATSGHSRRRAFLRSPHVESRLMSIIECTPSWFAKITLREISFSLRCRVRM